MRRIFVVVGIALAGLTVCWHFWLGSRWTMRFPRDGDFSTTYIGTETNADASGVLPRDDRLGTYERRIRVVDASDWPRTVLLEDKLRVRDIQRGAVLFEHVTEERIDPRTGAWAAGPHKGDIVLFPRNAEKRAYIVRSSYAEGVTLQFSGERNVGGLTTFLYSYRGPLDVSAIYRGTAASPGIRLPADQEIHCADDQFYYRVWVDPLTGEQAKVEEGCLAGDFIYDKVTGRQGAAVDRWNGGTSGGDLGRRVTQVFDARREYAWAAFYLPGILLVGSIAALFIGFRGRSGLAEA
jgi:hypothetical protein